MSSKRNRVPPNANQGWEDENDGETQSDEDDSSHASWMQPFASASAADEDDLDSSVGLGAWNKGIAMDDDDEKNGGDAEMADLLAPEESLPTLLSSSGAKDAMENTTKSLLSDMEASLISLDEWKERRSKKSREQAESSAFDSPSPAESNEQTIKAGRCTYDQGTERKTMERCFQADEEARHKHLVTEAAMGAKELKDLTREFRDPPPSLTSQNVDASRAAKNIDPVWEQLSKLQIDLHCEERMAATVRDSCAQEIGSRYRRRAEDGSGGGSGYQKTLELRDALEKEMRDMSRDELHANDILENYFGEVNRVLGLPKPD